MTKVISGKNFKAIRDDTTISVVSFNKEGRRTMTYGNCNVISAVDQVIAAQKRGMEALIIRNLPMGETSWDRKDYDKYIKDNHFLFYNDFCDGIVDY